MKLFDKTWKLAVSGAVIGLLVMLLAIYGNPANMDLEKELHTQLLKRTTKTLSVTPAGQTLYNYAAEILDLRHKAILELSNEQETMLHIGVSSVPSLYLLYIFSWVITGIAEYLYFRASYKKSIVAAQMW